MATFGLTDDDYDDVIVHVLPDVWPVFRLFQSLSTQWRIGFGGATGLDYNVLPWLMRVHGIEDEATTLKDIRIMEKCALTIMHKR
ncbi:MULTISPECIES: DUF1799 domain-containing protein [Enterobacter]|jgi:hypothetical protein|uniref:DUF1799 domain-containing protein n=1 Tax=Enterobacter TaxID=547 RepID=UPI001BE02962|nr:DUF1799 domain-containing protein [Enterobacter mori]EMD2763833.1 DUF1799 domain-containing protein [Enterobacter asburiae]MBT1882309.1 DUF1799 domain-containing protein [Enterobacter mori]MCW4855041.1 DUF1799 domain-containing protein [Enterobacter mori]HED4182465.1 DUF1799 domain-containing protein [Enterobacter mori]